MVYLKVTRHDGFEAIIPILGWTRTAPSIHDPIFSTEVVEELSDWGLSGVEGEHEIGFGPQLYADWQLAAQNGGGVIDFIPGHLLPPLP